MDRVDTNRDGTCGRERAQPLCEPRTVATRVSVEIDVPDPLAFLEAVENSPPRCTRCCVWACICVDNMTGGTFLPSAMLCCHSLRAENSVMYPFGCPYAHGKSPWQQPKVYCAVSIHHRLTLAPTSTHTSTPQPTPRQALAKGRFQRRSQHPGPFAGCKHISAAAYMYVICI